MYRRTGLWWSVLAMSLLGACVRVPAGNPNVAPQIKPVSYLSGKSQQQDQRVMGKPGRAAGGRTEPVMGLL